MHTPKNLLKVLHMDNIYNSKETVPIRRSSLKSLILCVTVFWRESTVVVCSNMLLIEQTSRIDRSCSLRPNHKMKIFPPDLSPGLRRNMIKLLSILADHWHLLTSDNRIARFITPSPTITFSESHLNTLSDH